MTCRIFLAAAFFALSSLAGNQDEAPNVNSRYTVESISVSGKRTTRLSRSTRREIEALVGHNLDHGILDKFAARIRHELRADDVNIHVSKGTEPEHVKVEFLVEGKSSVGFDVDVPKGIYHSKQGWSGAANIASTSFGDHNEFKFGIVSDGDSAVERFAGLRAAYERTSVGTDRVSIRFQFESFHDQWNNSSLVALRGANDLTRSRQVFEPTVSVILAEPLTLTVGASAEIIEPGQGSTISANAAIAGLRYHQRWNNPGSTRQELDAGYSLRAAGSVLASDFVYTRQTWHVRYSVRHEQNSVTADFLAGRITGQAPLYERFVLGNAGTLRGWNKYDLDPLGGDRVVHGSVEYGYRWLQAFYDTGAIWNRNGEPDQKQSIGAGIGKSGKEGFLLAVAFPLRSGHVEPMFIAGFNF